MTRACDSFEISDGRGGEWSDGEIESECGGDATNDNDNNDDDDPLLDSETTRLYRGVAARLNYLAPDRPDIEYSVKEAARANVGNDGAPHAKE